MSDKVRRLHEIATAIAKGDRDELTMRIPAEPDRDADLVVSWAATEIDRLRGLLREARGEMVDWLIENRPDLVARIDAALAGAADQPSAESCEADVLLTALGLDAERFRTECGFINVPKVLAALKHPDYYRGLYLRTADNGNEGQL